jgi:hypothetical protein
LDEAPNTLSSNLNCKNSDYLDAERLRAGLDNLDRLRMTIVCDKKFPAGCNRVAQRHRFGGGGSHRGDTFAVSSAVRSVIMVWKFKALEPPWAISAW